MAEVLRLPDRDPPPARQKRDRPADIVDLSRRDLFNMRGLRETAAEFNQLPNPRDVEAAIEAAIRDFRRIVKRRYGATGSPVDGAAIAIRAALRAEINRLRKDRIP